MGSLVKVYGGVTVKLPGTADFDPGIGTFNLTSAGAPFFSVGPALTWNLFDRGAIHARIRQADAGAAVRLAQYEATVTTALSGLDAPFERWLAEGLAPRDAARKAMEEVTGPVIAVACEGDEEVEARADDVIYVPRVTESLQPLVAVVPLQLLAYHTAILRGCDVDKPRNLAKSVTVE